MSLRAPRQYRAKLEAITDRNDPLGYEIAGEKASSLGRAGHRVQMALTVLRDFEANLAEEGDTRRTIESPKDRVRHEELLRAAARAVHAYFIQRELCGLRRQKDAIDEYAIPRSVLARLGVN